MFVCCWLAGLLALAGAVVLVGWILVRDRRCGLPLLILAMVSLGGRVSLGESATESCCPPQMICNDPASTALAVQAMQGMNGSAVVTIEPIFAEMMRTFTLQATIVFAIAAMLRGVFLACTREREWIYKRFKTTRRWVYLVVLRRKVLPPCCYDEDYPDPSAVSAPFSAPALPAAALEQA